MLLHFFFFFFEQLLRKLHSSHWKLHGKFGARYYTIWATAGLQLKKKAAIITVSPDFKNQSKNAKTKRLNLLLKEVNEISNDENIKFDKTVKLNNIDTLV